MNLKEGINLLQISGKLVYIYDSIHENREKQKSRKIKIKKLKRGKNENQENSNLEGVTKIRKKNN